jgi:hypothetical protein
MTPKGNCDGNLRKSISGIFGKKFMGTHYNALHVIYRNTRDIFRLIFGSNMTEN